MQAKAKASDPASNNSVVRTSPCMILILSLSTARPSREQCDIVCMPMSTLRLLSPFIKHAL